MLEMKGTAICTIPKFILSKFGQEKYKLWLDALPKEIGDKFSSEILTANKWYPFTEYYTGPVKIMCDLFYNKDPRGCHELGIYNANINLKGVYSIFLAVSSVRFLLSKAQTLLSLFFRPAKIEVPVINEKDAIIRVVSLPGSNIYVENNIAGWTEGALLLSGCKNVKITMTKTLSNNFPYSEYIAEWD